MWTEPLLIPHTLFQQPWYFVSLCRKEAPLRGKTHLSLLFQGQELNFEDDGTPSFLYLALGNLVQLICGATNVDFSHLHLGFT